MSLNTYTFYHSPLGTLILVSSGSALVSINFAGDEIALPTTLRRDDAIGRAAAVQLEEYFCGIRRVFELRLEPTGTPFQLAVWLALQRIPYGETLSYAQLAEAIGQPLATRAVGSACGRNPLPIVIPCHRVVAANRGLGGYSSGLDKKRFLLSLEAK